MTTSTPLPRNARTRKAIRNYERVWRLWNKNLTVPEMAAKLHVSRQRVYALLKQVRMARRKGYF